MNNRRFAERSPNQIIRTMRLDEVDQVVMLTSLLGVSLYLSRKRQLTNIHPFDIRLKDIILQLKPILFEFQLSKNAGIRI
jgi:hypothetical protein